MYDGKDIRFGNKISFSDKKSRRKFKPNVMVKRVYSELLGEMIPFHLTASTLKSIDKYGGLDAYLLTSKKIIEGQGFAAKERLLERMEELSGEQIDRKDPMKLYNILLAETTAHIKERNLLLSQQEVAGAEGGASSEVTATTGETVLGDVEAAVPTDEASEETSLEEESASNSEAATVGGAGAGLEQSTERTPTNDAEGAAEAETQGSSSSTSEGETK